VASLATNEDFPELVRLMTTIFWTSGLGRLLVDLDRPVGADLEEDIGSKE
jgi:hypothetical protein